MIIPMTAFLDDNCTREDEDVVLAGLDLDTIRVHEGAELLGDSGHWSPLSGELEIISYEVAFDMNVSILWVLEIDLKFVGKQSKILFDNSEQLTHSEDLIVGHSKSDHLMNPG